MKKPKANSRQKGAQFERTIAAELFGLTGVSFKRNLEQYQTKDLGDLTPDNPAWPFSLELKRYASGKTCKPAWRVQASTAAQAAQKFPAVIYKYDRGDTTVSVPFAAIAKAFGEGEDTSGEWAEINLAGLAYLASEIMAVESNV